MDTQRTEFIEGRKYNPNTLGDRFRNGPVGRFMERLGDVEETHPLLMIPMFLPPALVIAVVDKITAKLHRQLNRSKIFKFYYG